MIWIGTSGFQYPEWKGSFYPEKLSTKKMLSFYAEHFSTTEINYSFYRIPAASTLENWSKETPDNFRFTFKAPQLITHRLQLKNAEETLRHFCTVLKTVENKLGAVLFQLPPFFRKNISVLEAFLKSLPTDLKFAFEFRHVSWFDDETYNLLKSENVALCIADSEKLTTPVVFTADFGYFRLRHEGYAPKDIARWAKVISAEKSQLKETYIYFKHEEGGVGPKFAKQLIEQLQKI